MTRTTLLACVALALSACTTSATKVGNGAVIRDAYGKPVLAKVP